MNLFKKKNVAVKDSSKNKSAQNTSSSNNIKPKVKIIGKSLNAWIIQPAAIVLTLLVLMYVLLEFLFIQNVEHQSINQSKAMLSTLVKQDFDTYVQARSLSLANLSRSENTRQALLDNEKYKQMNVLLHQLWSGLDQFYVISTEDSNNLSSHYPQLSFASIDLVRRNIVGQKTKVEAFFDKGQWYFQIAEAIKVDEKIQGAVLATFRLSSLKSILNISPALPSGEMAIVNAKDLSKPIIAIGVGDLAEAVYLPTTIDQWKIRYSPDLGHFDSLDRTLVWLILGVLGLVLVALIIIIIRLNMGRVRQDILKSSKYLKKALTGEGKVPTDFSFGEFHSLVSSASQQIDSALHKQSKNSSSDNDSNKSQQSSADQGAKPATNIAENRDAPLFDDELLDLDVLAEDHSETPINDINNDLEGNIDDMVTEVAPLDLDIPQSIFRAYDIRGVVDDTLNEGVVELLGKAIASEALAQGQTTLCVGYDGRLSSVTYCEALTRGIISTGINAIIIGQVPTPVLYFATHHFDTGSGVMITGSHNPSNYNGFKMMLAGKTLSGNDIQKLYNRIILQDFTEGQGARSSESIDRQYLDTILNDIAVASPLKVVLDAGNGVAGGIAPELIEELGCEVIPLFCEVDGTFPNHHPDPGKPENLQDLIAAVKEHDADIGLAFDGDGDRLGVVTNEGKIIWPDRLLMLFAKDVISRNPGADIIFDVKCSRRLNGLISGYGGRPIMWKTGHSLIKAKMQETGALLAGEMSGHVFFKERWYGFDDGLYSAARLLEILGVEDKTSDEVFADFPEDLSTPEINIAVSDETKFDIVEKLCERKEQFTGGNVATIDGLRVDYPNGWGLCRASNTTPVLVLRFEADDEASLQEIKNKFIDQLKIVDPTLDCNF